MGGAPASTPGRSADSDAPRPAQAVSTTSSSPREPDSPPSVTPNPHKKCAMMRFPRDAEAGEEDSENFLVNDASSSPADRPYSSAIATSSSASADQAAPGTLISSGGNDTAEVIIKKHHTLTIGYLPAVKGKERVKERQGLAISGAITFALHEINTDPDILPGVHLSLQWEDTRGDTVLTTRAITQMICGGVSAFFGPEGSCNVEAIISEASNKPMISYKCSDYKASEIPTFARTEPPHTQVTKSIIALLSYYNWKKFSVLSEKAWESVGATLVKEAEERGMTINHNEVVGDQVSCCAKKMDCCHSGQWYRVIHETKNLTRIYVFLGDPTSLIDMMGTMQALQLFDNGEYLVITVDTMTYTSKEAMKFLWKPEVYQKFNSCYDQKEFAKRGHSLLVIMASPPSQNYDSFTENVRKYSAMPPFKFVVPDIFKGINLHKHVSIYAAYLYDSVKLYARALDTLLRQKGHSAQHLLSPENITAIASDGKSIIQAIINNGSYQSVTGANINLDKNGDSEGNFSVLALRKHEEPLVHQNFSCPFQLLPVGLFLQGKTLEYRLINSSSQIIWAGTRKPVDEPICGFLNEHCRRPDDKSGWREISAVVATVLALLLFCAMVCTLYVYRKWKIEQEIEGLLWRIHPSQLHSYFQGGIEIVSSPSKLSLVSGVSYESRCGMQLFATTGFYKGSVVRVKELRFGIGKEDRGGGSNSGIGLHNERERSGTGTPHISRETMKEMRILRELRHDNINSFVGACVMESSGQVLIVTDYSAKGSLYDIVENEDIKLDEMFIASLVHDLIKGMLYLHNSPLGCHGNLKSSNCVVTSRWILQVTDFGLHELRQGAESDSIGEHQYYRSLLWKAPELLRGRGNLRGGRGGIAKGTQKGDVYAFAIILYELFGRRGPFGITAYEPIEIVNFVRQGVVGTPEWANPKRRKRKAGKESLHLKVELDNEEEFDEKKIDWLKEGKKFNEEGMAESNDSDEDVDGEIEPFRPDLDYLSRNDNVPQYIISCIQDCWAEDPDARPDFHTIRSRLKKMREGMHRNIMDQMMEMMEKYAYHLEELVSQRTKLLYEEKQKTEDLLHRMLPAPVASCLTKGIGVEPESFDSVTIYFSDIVGFTAMSAESSPLEVVNFLNDLYTLFDRIIRGYDVYKVETIGDAYMVVSGLPLRNGDCHAGEIASMSLDLLEAVANHCIAHRPTEKLKLRIGIHTGPVVAGVVGLTMPRYCLFGDTVNTASRMESSGEPLRIHISDSCRLALEHLGGYIIEERGLVFVKGKGDVKTHWLIGANPEEAIQRREDPDLPELAPLFSRPATLGPVGRRSPKMSSGAGNCSRRQSGISRWADSPDTVPSSSPMRRKQTGTTFEEEDEDEDAQMSDTSRKRGGSLGIDAAQLALKRGSRDLLSERRGSGGLLAALGRTGRPPSGRANRDSSNFFPHLRESGSLAEVQSQKGSMMEDQRGSIPQLDPSFSSKLRSLSKVNPRREVSDGITVSSGTLARAPRKRSGSAMNILSEPGNSLEHLADGEFTHRRSFHELLLPKAVERLQHERPTTPVRFEPFSPLKGKDILRSKLNLQKEGIHSSQNPPMEENSRLLFTGRHSPNSSHESVVTATHCNTPPSNSSVGLIQSSVSHENASISMVDDPNSATGSLILTAKKDDDSEATVQFDMSLDKDASHAVGKPNGGIHDLKGFEGDTMEGEEVCSKGAKAPLLSPPSPQSSSVSSVGGRKKWKSLEEMGQGGRSSVGNHGKHGKSNLRSWLLGFFGGSNGMRGSSGGRAGDGKGKDGLGSHSDRESMV
ncbi:receptor-type guanylate cyclase Gyc76C-like [Hetaerina americana]|uniref:receptor-type guanylate cyclase Gyc76C-like n=1 Tax=Hetaerina americana TaxID=62018 RepID=UPI003A7F37E9